MNKLIVMFAGLLVIVSVLVISLNEPKLNERVASDWAESKCGSEYTLTETEDGFIVNCEKEFSAISGYDKVNEVALGYSSDPGKPFRIYLP